MITYLQAIILGLTQGISELFPVSSLGHSVIIPKLLGWGLNQADPSFLTFLVATHFATATVLVIFFWKDWVRIIGAFFRSIFRPGSVKGDVYARLAWLLIVGTIPAGILGLALQKKLELLFDSAGITAFFLIVNGLMLLLAEAVRKKHEIAGQEFSDDRIATTKYKSAFSIGAVQALALIPGMSRSGASMAGGLLAGLTNEDAARFSFLLATPVIAAAALLKLPQFAKPENHALIGPALVGAVCAGIAAYFSVKFLVRYFQTKRLTAFGWYCIIAGIISLIIFWVK